MEYGDKKGEKYGTEINTEEQIQMALYSQSFSIQD